MNAIILAAGLGSRFHEITKNNHKALLPIGGIPNIERTITYLRAAGIEEIFIVTGHQAEKFEYLKAKYQVTLLYNEHYADYNNIYSFYKAIDHFKDSYLIDADVVLLKNMFTTNLSNSQYFTIQRTKNNDVEWCPVCAQERVIAMDISDAYQPSMLGISYWCESDCAIIKKALSTYLDETTLTNPKLYWDNIPISFLSEMYVTTNLMDARYVDEMDTVENYEQICQKLASLVSA